MSDELWKLKLETELVNELFCLGLNVSDLRDGYRFEITFLEYNFSINLYQVYYAPDVWCTFPNNKNNLKFIIKNIDKFLEDNGCYGIKYADLKEVLSNDR